MSHRRTQPKPLSNFSTPSIPDSAWCSLDFMLGAGMVLIQRNTHKVVVVQDTKTNAYFFPRGRKDTGESLEKTALREAYEESGYRATFLPLFNPTRQPPPPDDLEACYRPNTEPIYISTRYWAPRKPRRQHVQDYGGEYLITWYVGQIAEDAVREEGTGMADEQTYVSHLLTFDEAQKHLYNEELKVLNYAWILYMHTLEEEKILRESRNLQGQQAGQSSEPGSHTKHQSGTSATV